MSRSCSQCGNNGHNSRTCAEAAACGGGGGVAGSSTNTNANTVATAENGIMLFGVRVTEGGLGSGGGFRKSISMTNLSQFDQPQENSNAADAGYASDDVVHASGRSRERKRGVPWTEEEHKLFLLGLQKVGKGDWRGISRNFVKTRTPTQVASHAQKYFLRRFNQNRRRRRSSLFDITTDTVMSEVEVHHVHHETIQQQQQIGGFQICPMATPAEDSIENLTLGPPKSTKLIRPIPVFPVPPSSKMADLNLNQKPNLPPLSLKLSSQSEIEPSSSSSQSSATHTSAFQAMSSGGDSIISVA